MKKTKCMKQIVNLLAVFVLLFGVVPFTAAMNVSTVFADGEEISDSEEASPTEVPPVENVPEEAAALIPDDELILEEPVVNDEAVAELPAGDEVIDAALPGEEAVYDEAGVAPEEDLSELVSVLSENDVQVIDETGEPLSMASQATEDLLLGTDPFYWTGTEWVGYTSDGTGCPDNVTCYASASPFQEAVNQAGTGNTIYVANGSYDEDVVVNTANLSFTAFYNITVPDASAPTVTLDSSGYAVVKSFTLNEDFNQTDGVYADYVVVNEAGKTGGRLDDAMALVNDGGRIEADVVIYGANGHYRVKDKNHAEINFEWECGEPNKVIYPGRTYRMTLMNPLDADILAYYEAHGDERSTLGPQYLDLSAIDRMDDLMIAVNVSEDYSSWSHRDEERIYWYLVGNTGYDNNGHNITLNSGQQAKADEITSGARDDVTRYWGIWFLYPTLENGKPVSADNRQLTFFVHDPRPVYGCMDPEAENFNPMADTSPEVDTCEYLYGCMDPDALNYDPEAIREDESCRYPNTITTPPTNFGPLPIPVTGNEEFIIPVTGIDPTENNGYGLLEALVLLGVIIFGTRIIFQKEKNQ